MWLHCLAGNSWKHPIGIHWIRALSGGGAFLPRAAGLVRQILGSNRLFVRPGHWSGQLSNGWLCIKPNRMQWRRSYPAGDPSRVYDRRWCRRAGLLRCQLGRRLQHSDGGGCHWWEWRVSVDWVRGGAEPAVPCGTTGWRGKGV